MIGFINTLYNHSYSHPITITHNQSSAETFFLDCRGLTPFSFSFYDWLLSLSLSLILQLTVSRRWRRKGKSRIWDSKILWHVNPLLGYATEVTQPASKHRPVNTSRPNTLRNDRRSGVFSVPCRAEPHCTTPVALQPPAQQYSDCFRWCPCRGVILKASGGTESVFKK
jgi:hypothetical protein